VDRLAESVEGHRVSMDKLAEHRLPEAVTLLGEESGKLAGRIATFDATAAACTTLEKRVDSMQYGLNKAQTSPSHSPVYVQPQQYQPHPQQFQQQPLQQAPQQQSQHVQQQPLQQAPQQFYQNTGVVQNQYGQQSTFSSPIRPTRYLPLPKTPPPKRPRLEYGGSAVYQATVSTSDYYYMSIS
jgi:hypothetical protein